MNNTAESSSPYDPYALLLDPYAPIPTPTSEAPDESDGNCYLGKAIDACDLGPAGDLIAAYGLVAIASFVIASVAAAIFSGPILATGLWFAATVTIGIGVLHAITEITEGHWSEEDIELLSMVAIKIIVISSFIIGMHLGVL